MQGRRHIHAREVRSCGCVVHVAVRERFSFVFRYSFKSCKRFGQGQEGEARESRIRNLTFVYERVICFTVQMQLLLRNAVVISVSVLWAFRKGRGMGM